MTDNTRATGSQAESGSAKALAASLNGCLTPLNYGLGVIGLVGVALRTHDWVAVVFAFIAALHFTARAASPSTGDTKHGC